MRLATFSTDNNLRIGVAVSSTELVDLSDLTPNLPGAMTGDMLAFIKAGPIALASLRAALGAGVTSGVTRVLLSGVEWRAPILSPSKIVCIALNNRALDAIKIRAPTDHPAFFIKTQSALVGCGQAIRLKTSYGLTHPEPELAVVIGRQLSEVSPAEAMESVFGYSIMNDVTSVSMREEDSFTFRYHRPDPMTGGTVEAEGHTTYPGRYKGSDTFAPMGPWIVTQDDVTDPNALDIKCWLGGKLVAHDNTSNYIWSVPDALSQISKTMTLLPGDIVSMGTAVGAEGTGPDKSVIPSITKANLTGHEGPVVIEIAGLGRLSNPIVTRN